MIAVLLLAFVLVVVALTVSVFRLRWLGEADEEFITPAGHARIGIDSRTRFPSERRTQR